MVFCYDSFSTFCCCSVVKWCLTLCNGMDCSVPAFPVLHHIPEFAQTLVHWVGDAIQPSQPLSSPSLSAFHLSHHQGLLQWAGSSSKYWHFSFSTSPANGDSGLISFRIDWFNLLAVQGTLEVLSRNTIWKYQFFGTWPSLCSSSHYPYLTTGKNIVLTTWTFVSKVMSLLFNKLSRFVIAFLPKSKHLLI